MTAVRHAAEAIQAGDTSVHGLAPYEEGVEQLIGRQLAQNYRLRQRIPPEQRSNRRFVRMFAVVADGK
jgi:hypothetical protein